MASTVDQSADHKAQLEGETAVREGYGGGGEDGGGDTQGERSGGGQGEARRQNGKTRYLKPHKLLWIKAY